MDFRIESGKQCRYSMIKKYLNWSRKMKDSEKYSAKSNIYIWLILDKLLKISIWTSLTIIDKKSMNYLQKKLISQFLSIMKLNRKTLSKYQINLILTSTNLQNKSTITRIDRTTHKIYSAANWVKKYFSIPTM